MCISQALPAWVSLVSASTCVTASLWIIEPELLDVVLPSLFRFWRAAYWRGDCFAESGRVAVTPVSSSAVDLIIFFLIYRLFLWLSFLKFPCRHPLFHYSLLPFNFFQIPFSLLLVVVVLQTVFWIKKSQILLWKITSNGFHIFLCLFMKHFLVFLHANCHFLVLFFLSNIDLFFKSNDLFQKINKLICLCHVVWVESKQPIHKFNLKNVWILRWSRIIDMIIFSLWIDHFFSNIKFN